MQTTKSVAVRFDRISFGYDETLVVKEVSFEIYQPEYVCIIGHNGSGKSTISKLLTGLLKPRSGTIYLYGHPVTKTNLKFLRDNVGIVFQNPDNQFIGITAEDDIAFGLENRKFPRNEMRAIVHNVAKQVGIEHILKVEPHKLSGGQKQRVAIASILAINPSVILFDESTSMLDPKGKIDIKQFMITLKNSGKSIISVTHDMEEVINADRVFVMNHGHLVRVGKPEEIFQDEEFLREIRLDIPFTFSLGKELNKKNPLIQPTLNQPKLIRNILQCIKNKN